MSMTDAPHPLIRRLPSFAVSPPGRGEAGRCRFLTSPRRGGVPNAEQRLDPGLRRDDGIGEIGIHMPDATLTKAGVQPRVSVLGD